MASRVQYLECPSCYYTFNTFYQSLFKIFRCDNCGRRFRGIHGQCLRRTFSLSFYYKFKEDNWSPCPNQCSLSGVTELVYIGSKGSALREGNNYCEICGCYLPVSPAIKESNDPWQYDEDEEYWAKKKAKEDARRAVAEAAREKRKQEQIDKEQAAKELEEELNQQKLDKEQAAKELEEKINRLIFWEDYLKISALKPDLEELKQNLLDNFELSKQVQYRTALQKIEEAMKKPS